MHKWIRWPGLVAFILIFGLLAAITLLFLDTWIKLAVEKGLAQKTGAEVNVGAVSHSFGPFGVTLTDLQVTDATQPSNNQVQADQVAATIDIGSLLRRKVIIDEMTIAGLQFDQPRKSVGRVYRQPEAEDDAGASLPFTDTESLPSVDEVLDSSPLKTTKAIEAAQAAYARHKQTLAQKYAALPSKDKFAEYQQRVKALTETDYKNPVELAKAKEQFDILKSELKQDRQQLNEFKQAVAQAKADLSPTVAELKSAPAQDYNLLKGLVAGDAAVMEEVTSAIFGQQAGQWSQYLLSAYQIAAPMLSGDEEATAQQQRMEGRWIEFDDTSQLPDILIRSANISLKWQDENLTSRWQNITHQHDILGQATQFAINSTSSSLWQSFKLDGDFWLKAAGMDANQVWDLQGLKLADVPMLEQDKLSSKLLSGVLSSVGALTINTDQLNGNGSIDLASLAIQAKGSNNLTNIIAETLNGLSSLKIDTALSGLIHAPELAFSSSLDKELKQAILNNLSAGEQSKLNELKAKLDDKASAALGTSDAQLSQWLDWESLANGNLGNIDDMLNAQFKGVLDKEKDKLKDKLKSKLFGG